MWRKMPFQTNFTSLFFILVQRKSIKISRINSVFYHSFMCQWLITDWSLTFLMSSRQLISGESPPCTHRNCWLSRAARGRQSKASIQASYTRSEYLILPAADIWRQHKTWFHFCSSPHPIPNNLKFFTSFWPQNAPKFCCICSGLTAVLQSAPLRRTHMHLHLLLSSHILFFHYEQKKIKI